jgi:hypothetical protein
MVLAPQAGSHSQVRVPQVGCRRALAKRPHFLTRGATIGTSAQTAVMVEGLSENPNSPSQEPSKELLAVGQKKDPGTKQRVRQGKSPYAISRRGAPCIQPGCMCLNSSSGLCFKPNSKSDLIQPQMAQKPSPRRKIHVALRWL